MRRERQLGMIVLAITVAAMLIVGAGSVFAQEGNETTATDNTSEYNCNETVEYVAAVGEDGNVTRTVPAPVERYWNRSSEVKETLEREYADVPGVESVHLTEAPNKTICGGSVGQIGVAIDFSQFNGTIPDQRNGVPIKIEGSIQAQDAGGSGVNEAGGEAVSEETTTGETITGETTIESSGSGEGKAKQSSDGNDGATDGGNGKAKMSDGDSEDTANGGNGKTKAG